MDDRLVWLPPDFAEPIQISVSELFEEVEDDWF
jgi:hypothetical protein